MSEMKSGDVGAFKPISVPVQQTVETPATEQVQTAPAFKPRTVSSNATTEQAHDSARVVSGSKVKKADAKAEPKAATQDW